MKLQVAWLNSPYCGRFFVHKPLTESAAREPINLCRSCGGDSK